MLRVPGHETITGIERLDDSVYDASRLCHMVNRKNTCFEGLHIETVVKLSATNFQHKLHIKNLLSPPPLSLSLSLSLRITNANNWTQQTLSVTSVLSSTPVRSGHFGTGFATTQWNIYTIGSWILEDFTWRKTKLRFTELELKGRREPWRPQQKISANILFTSIKHFK